MDKKFYKALEKLEGSTFLEVDLFNIDDHEVLVARMKRKKMWFLKARGLLETSSGESSDSMEPRSSWDD